MADEIAIENGRISHFKRLVTLTLDRVILHTIMHHSSTSTYTPNFTEIEKKNFLWTNGRTKVRAHVYVQTNIWDRIIRSTLSKSRPKTSKNAVKVRNLESTNNRILHIVSIFLACYDRLIRVSFPSAIHRLCWILHTLLAVVQMLNKYFFWKKAEQKSVGTL